MAVLALLEFNKLIAVILKVFTEIAIQGFCPVQDMDEVSVSDIESVLFHFDPVIISSSFVFN